MSTTNKPQIISQGLLFCKFLVCKYTPKPSNMTINPQGPISISYCEIEQQKAGQTWIFCAN